MPNLSNVHTIHFMGIKGVGMAGLAIIAKQLGYEVQGSDLAEVFITDEELHAQGIEPLHGFDPKRVEGVDLVVATGAHQGKHNPEVKAAIERGIPVLMHAEALSWLTRDKTILAVCGAHGKTTTSALLAWVLDQAGLKPGYLAGTSGIAGLPGAAAAGESQWFVVEADEYMNDPQTDRTPRFHYLKPDHIIATNLEHDHPDRYPTLESVQAVFAQFFELLPDEGKLIACADSEPLLDVLPNQSACQTYGTTDAAQFPLKHYRVEDGTAHWELATPGGTLALRSNRLGMHFALNASAVALLAWELGLTAEQIQSGIASFGGLKRRFEQLGAYQGVPVIDDYAHHPTEIQATLRAARASFPDKRLITVFQPHTFSRTRLLFDQFSKAFADADVVLIPPIFASAREADDPGMTHTKLVSAIQAHHPQAQAVDSLEAVLDWLRSHAKSGDVILTLGAGDVYKVGEKLVC